MDTLLRAGTIRSIKEVWWDVRPHPASLRDERDELFRMLQPVAERLGCASELQVVNEVLERGASDERQRAVMAAGGRLTNVVDALVTEFAEDGFVGPEESSHVAQ